MLKVELFIIILRYIVHNPDPGLKSKAFVPGSLAKVEPVFFEGKFWQNFNISSETLS
jgi:hypothetical protein